MDAQVSMVLAAMSAAMLALLPLALRRRAAQPEGRDSAWRDRLPLPLAVVRPWIRWYASSVDASLTAVQREVIQSRLNAAGAAYLIAPAELIVLRRLAFVLGAMLAAYVVLVLKVDDPMYVAATAALAPFAWLYPDIWLRDSTGKRQRRFEKEFPFFLDVLVLGMRAGLTFTASVEQSLAALGDGPVKEEFSRYLRETRSGVTRRAALDRLAARVALAAVTNFTASVMQA